jgi:hypothetical protein
MHDFPSFGRPLSASLKGEIASPIDLPRGCRFASRAAAAALLPATAAHPLSPSRAVSSGHGR